MRDSDIKALRHYSRQTKNRRTVEAIRTNAVGKMKVYKLAFAPKGQEK